MEHNDFYEVDGCIDFIPVKLIKEHKHINLLEVKVMGSGSRTFAPSIYKLLKVQEPQKVVIPKFVAEWLKEEQHAHTLLKVLNSAEYQRGIYPSTMNDWILDNQYDFIKAWLDGYEIEKEKLYTVEIPNPNINTHTVLQKTEKGLVLATVGNTGWAEWESSKLTESEIKQDFDFLWQWAKEVETDE